MSKCLFIAQYYHWEILWEKCCHLLDRPIREVIWWSSPIMGSWGNIYWVIITFSHYETCNAIVQFLKVCIKLWMMLGTENILPSLHWHMGCPRLAEVINNTSPPWATPAKSASGSERSKYRVHQGPPLKWESSDCTIGSFRSAQVLAPEAPVQAAEVGLIRPKWKFWVAPEIAKIKQIVQHNK